MDKKSSSGTHLVSEASYVEKSSFVSLECKINFTCFYIRNIFFQTVTEPNLAPIQENNDSMDTEDGEELSESGRQLSFFLLLLFPWVYIVQNTMVVG